ncbi:10823_t:CDS:2 [Dentiscutata heterogama]|uniref:10823_t:CDS:1 n=1 Tax=Dentiscutata heterogama TaxID=1316150 RepID=A0ACA9LMK2_9GLOM|nr:10823_t:CDS:2 [Dentiscutata heterogama]
MSTKEGNRNCKRESNEARGLTDKRRKTKANKSTTSKDIADTSRLKRRTLLLLENNRSKENILCAIKKSSGHGEVKSTTRKVATTEMQIETGVHSTEQKKNIQNTILEQILQRLNAIELRQRNVGGGCLDPSNTEEEYNRRK